MKLDHVWKRIGMLPWRWIAPLFATFGLLQFIYRALDRVARGAVPDWAAVFTEELTGAAAGLAITPILMGIAFAFPFTRGGWRRHWPIYLAAGVFGGFLHTSIMYAFRLSAFALMGRGLYDYGDMRVRYFMELPAQLIWIAVIFTIASYSELRRLSRERESRLELLERQVTQAQLETLQLQLQPHFLFNALNAISAIVHEDPRAAEQMVASLSEFLRRVLRTERALEVPLREELSLLQLYLEVMRGRFEDKLRCTVSAAPEVGEALVPQLILQPLVENALRYAADPRTGVIEVSVNIWSGQGQLHLEIRDKGDASSNEPSGGGMGLANLEARLTRLYGAACRLTLSRVPGQGTSVTVELPFHTESVLHAT